MNEAVVELASEAIGRGVYPSPVGYTCISEADIHLLAVIPAVSGGYPSSRKCA
jgi:hypothetical protein